MTRLPCPTCPWRLDQDASVIPNFRLDLAEGLANTCPDEHGFGPDWDAPMFACHQSGAEMVVCAGWLAVHGDAHPRARLLIASGEWSPDALRSGDGWPPLHGSFREVIEKLRATTPRRNR